MRILILVSIASLGEPSSESPLLIKPVVRAANQRGSSHIVLFVINVQDQASGEIDNAAWRKRIGHRLYLGLCELHSIGLEEDLRVHILALVISRVFHAPGLEIIVRV